MDPNFSFTSERLLYKHLLPDRDDHCEFIVKLYNEPLFIEGEGNTGIDTFEKARKRVQRFAEDYERNKYGQFVVHLKDTGKMIGTVCLTRGADSTMLLPDIGFAIITEENGKGYGSEAGRAMIDWVKRERGVPGVLGFCDDKNARSKRAMEKCGLEFKGIFTIWQFGNAQACCFAPPGIDPVAYGVGAPKPETSS